MSRRRRATDDTDQSFLRRWSRRKAGSVDPGQGVADTRAGPHADEGHDAAANTHPAPDVEPTRTEQDQPQDLKTDEDMPDLDSLTETSDVSEFFSPGVSEELRNQALRRLFRMSKFNVSDGLDDYCEDFRGFGPLGDLVTSDMRHRMQMDQQREESRRGRDGEGVEGVPDSESTAGAPDEHESDEHEGKGRDAERLAAGDSGPGDAEEAQPHEPDEETDGEASSRNRT